jgi:hypothetical protein
LIAVEAMGDPIDGDRPVCMFIAEEARGDEGIAVLLHDDPQA